MKFNLDVKEVKVLRFNHAWFQEDTMRSTGPSHKVAAMLLSSQYLTLQDMLNQIGFKHGLIFLLHLAR
jgi:hypothetical protein